MSTLLLESEYVNIKPINPVKMWTLVNRQMDDVLKANPEVRIITYCRGHVLKIQVDPESIATIRSRLRLPRLWWTCNLEINAYTMPRAYSLYSSD